MEVKREEEVLDRPKDELLLGTSTWDPPEASLKYAWKDKLGRRARGGELPIAALPQAVRFAAREGYLSREATASIAKDLVDLLAEAPTSNEESAEG